jgi:hypothetical protein
VVDVADILTTHVKDGITNNTMSQQDINTHLLKAILAADDMSEARVSDLEKRINGNVDSIMVALTPISKDFRERRGMP